MLEYPECRVVAAQMKDAVVGRRVAEARVGATPHSFAFYADSTENCAALLQGRRIESATPMGAYIRLVFEGGAHLMLGDGINNSYLAPGSPEPDKHQLCLKLEDGGILYSRIAMYGCVWITPGPSENPYHTVAREAPDVLDEGFTPAYFDGLVQKEKPTLSAKALLATGQRIPGIGNGVLQDILLNAGIHPKMQLGKLSDATREGLYGSIRQTLADMVEGGGRDTEKDLYGQRGGYRTLLHTKAVKSPCPRCGGVVNKQAYLGGSVYWCPACQPL